MVKLPTTFAEFPQTIDAVQGAFWSPEHKSALLERFQEEVRAQYGDPVTIEVDAGSWQSARTLDGLLAAANAAAQVWLKSFSALSDDEKIARTESTLEKGWKYRALAVDLLAHDEPLRARVLAAGDLREARILLVDRAVEVGLSAMPNDRAG
jgi:hypothetical protein